MQRRRSTRLCAAAAVALAIALTGHLPASAQSQQPPISICHRTGSPTNPWVFMTIDPATWPEHQAAGDVQARSLAECPSATAPAPAAPEAPAAPAAQPAATATPAPTAAGQRQQGAPAGAAVPDVSASQLRSVLGQSQTPAPSAPTPPPPAGASVETAGVSASANQTALAGDPSSISSLPRGGGEPDRVPQVLGLLAIGTAGLALRRIAGRTR